MGYASDGFYNDGYACDPYGGYDAYYDCDYGQGFANIGFGGGWYDSYFYPGYGFFLFDHVGRRYPMRTITVVIGAKSGNLITANTEVATVTAGATVAVRATTLMMQHRAS